MIMNTVKEVIMVNEGRNEQWMTVKEGNMMNEGKNENEWMIDEYLPRAD